MSEHLPECPILEPCCDDEQFPDHGFCGNFVGRCLHCMAECICERLRACEERVIDSGVQRVEALPWDYTDAGHAEALRQATALETPETVAQANYWYRQGQRDAISAAVLRVEAFEYVSTIGVVLASVIPKAAVIAAIDALREDSP